MPTRDSIAAEITQQKNAGQDSVRRRYLARLYRKTRRDTVMYCSSYNIQRHFPVPAAALSVSQDDIQGFMASLHGLKGKELDLIIHSPGGSVEAADQIVQYLRAKYGHIRAIIPQNAMSAATMLACAADEIVMGKHSALGPIDPQMFVPTPAGPAPVPAHTILKDFEKARADIGGNPMLAGLWAQWFSALPPGFINLCEQATSLSVERVEAWLAQYMFGGKSAAKAKEIAEWLANFEEHRTHGRPIGIELAKSRGLKVTSLEDDQELQEAVLSVFHATMVTFQATGCFKIIENHKGKGFYTVQAVAIQMPPTPQADVVGPKPSEVVH